VARRKNQIARDTRRGLRERVNAAVAEAFPGCVADFCGGVERSRMAVLGVTLGFRVREPSGKYRSNVIWLNPAYTGAVSSGWVERAASKSNGR
jgi:hypothetical protein